MVASGRQWSPCGRPVVARCRSPARAQRHAYAYAYACSCGVWRGHLGDTSPRLNEFPQTQG